MCALSAAFLSKGPSKISKNRPNDKWECLDRNQVQTFLHQDLRLKVRQAVRLQADPSPFYLLSVILAINSGCFWTLSEKPKEGAGRGYRSSCNLFYFMYCFSRLLQITVGLWAACRQIKNIGCKIGIKQRKKKKNPATRGSRNKAAQKKTEVKNSSTARK